MKTFFEPHTIKHYLTLVGISATGIYPVNNFLPLRRWHQAGWWHGRRIGVNSPGQYPVFELYNIAINSKVHSALCISAVMTAYTIILKHGANICK